ncbi:MAG: c-type cytochrome, partial [Planctomycetaceae bacterium]|nr:c-type cytochrome [Planctomycetaceae bacterium]
CLLMEDLCDSPRVVSALSFCGESLGRKQDELASETRAPLALSSLTKTPITEEDGEGMLPARRDILWRSRAKNTAAGLGLLLATPKITADDAPRYLRAFDFLSGPEKEEVLVSLAFHDFGDGAKNKFINAEALNRLKGFDVSKNEPQKAALNRILDSLKGQPQFVTLVEKFNVTDRYNDLLALAIEKPDDQIGIDAIRVLLNKEQQKLFAAALLFGKPTDKPEVKRATLALATVLSNSGDGRAAQLLLPVVESREHPADVRRQAIKGATRTKPGATAVLSLAEKKALDETFAPALAAALQTAPLTDDQRATVAKLFPAPAGKDSKPLPPLTELAKLKGNAGNGAKLFVEAKTAKCNTCHVVNNQGKEVGPNLSEIGSKLSRQAMWESIVFPSAGISHNYESYVLETKSGTVANGLKISEDADTVTLRGTDALNRIFKKSEIEEIKKQTISLMPADLAKTISIEEMADIVEYLTTLKKK